MNITAFIKTVRSLGITFEVVDGALKITAPKGALTPDLIRGFKEHKNGIISLFAAKDEKIIARAPEQDTYPLSFEQRRIWLLSQTDEGNKAYVIDIAFSLKGRLNVPALRQAIQAAVGRHEILRTRITGKAYYELRQQVLPVDAVPAELPVYDLSDSADAEAQCRDLLLSLMAIPFRFDDTLFRLALVQLREDHFVFYALFHHIIMDGWSSQVLFREIIQLYNDRVSGSSTTVKELPFQYKDFAVWQQQACESPEWQRQRAYWQQVFAGDIPVLELPLPGKRPLQKTLPGRNSTHTYSRALNERLKAFSVNMGVSQFTTVMSCLNLLLYRYTGQRDIVIGTPVATRPGKESEYQVGIYQNTLPVRTKLAEINTFEALVRLVETQLLNAYANSGYPFDQWVEALGIKPDPGRSVLFDVMAVFQGDAFVRGSSRSFADLSIAPWNYRDKRTSKFDLLFEFFDSEEGLRISVDYNTDLFDERYVEKLIAHFGHLLDAALTAKDAALDSLPFLEQEEYRQLVYGYNDTAISYAKEQSIVQAFSERAARMPDKQAVFFGDQSLTYREIEHCANQFAHFLLSRYTIKQEELIAFLHEKSLWTIPVLLGILKTGAAYVPIDITYPDERKEYLKRSVNCRITVDDQLLEVFLSQRPVLNEQLPAISVLPDQLAHVMFTSGTTGNPKGVMISHRNILRLADPSSYLPLNEETVLLSTVSVSFDTTNTEFWSVLINGGKVVLAERKQLLDYVQFDAILKRHDVNTLWLTASWFQHVAEHAPGLFSGLKWFISGGDIVSAKHVNLLKALYPRLEIVNGYGPTENTTFSTSYKIDGPMDGAIPIGKPLDNSQAYVLNDSLLPQPAGVTGTLYVAGDGLSRGYYGRPELTAERFIPNPFIEGALMYNTGDLARWLPDGNLEFLGRKDHLKKIMGRFIDTTEIEHALCSIAAVRQAVVLVRTVREERKIVAYLVSPDRPDTGWIREQLKKSLPDFMVPVQFLFVDAIPLSHNGKVDRNALPDPEAADAAPAQSRIILPASPTEEKLLEIWKDILKLEQISTTDNFFDLGGYSLTSVSLLAKITQVLNKAVTIRDLFEYPTIAGLATCLDTMREDAVPVARSLVPVTAAYYPLTFAQQRMWISNMRQPGRNAYVLTTAYEVSDNAAGSRIIRAFEKIIERHQLLRSIFPFEDGRPVQRVLDMDEAAGKIFTQETADAGYRIEAGYRQALLQPFDLTAEPPLKIRLIRSGARSYLLIRLHHIAYDAWSVRILAHEFRHFLESDKELKPLELQFRHYAHWQEQRFEAGDFDPMLGYWKKLLADLPGLPAYAPGAHDLSAEMQLRFSPEESSAIRRMSQSSGTEDTYVFLAAMSKAYALVFHEADFLCNFPFLGRKHEQVQELIGLFYQILVLRIRPQEQEMPAFAGALLRQVLDSVEQLDYPFERMMDEVPGLKQHSGRLSFNVISRPFIVDANEPFDNGRYTISPVSLDEERKFRTDITVDLYKNDTYLLSCTYNAARYTADEIAALLSRTREQLENIPDLNAPAVAGVPAADVGA